MVPMQKGGFWAVLEGSSLGFEIDSRQFSSAELPPLPSPRVRAEAASKIKRTSQHHCSPSKLYALFCSPLARLGIWLWTHVGEFAMDDKDGSGEPDAKSDRHRQTCPMVRFPAFLWICWVVTRLSAPWSPASFLQCVCRVCVGVASPDDRHITSPLYLHSGPSDDELVRVRIWVN